MKKYVIKNCSASVEYSNGAGKFIYCSCKDKLCENINDCTIKQIVDLCGKQKKWESEKMESGQIIEIYNGAYDFAQEVLGLLEIQEFGLEKKIKALESEEE